MCEGSKTCFCHCQPLETKVFMTEVRGGRGRDGERGSDANVDIQTEEGEMQLAVRKEAMNLGSRYYLRFIPQERGHLVYEVTEAEEIFPLIMPYGFTMRRAAQSADISQVARSFDRQLWLPLVFGAGAPVGKDQLVWLRVRRNVPEGEVAPGVMSIEIEEIIPAG